MSHLTTIVATLEQVVADLRRYSSHKHIDLAVLDCLADDDLSTDALAALIHRRRADVFRVIKLMEAAGTIVRIGQKWSRVHGR